MSDHTITVAMGCAVAVLLAGLVATAAALLARRDQATHPATGFRAAAAFGTTLALACNITMTLMATRR